jgi:hypothetical protein
LLLLFAPFAWLVRLLQSRWLAAALTVLFGVFVLSMRAAHSGRNFPPPLFSALLIGRIFSGALAVYFYLRGGALVSSWLGLLIEARHLPDLL